ncbi:MAG: response regulator transcription factor [Saprospiraceae bacterium]|nr:response regulator transcription factor [Saprospiraceae bacterium]
MSGKIKIGIIEDDSSVRSLIRTYIDQQLDMECLIESGSVEEFMDTVTTGHYPIQILIQDIGLPGISGLEAIRMVKNHFPKVDILMFSVFDDSNRIFKAFCAGASGYLLKNAKLPEIRQALLNIDKGHAAMSPSIAKKVIDYFKPTSLSGELTDKEQMVVQLLTDGLSYKMIADRMQISINTVQSHIRNIYKKLQVNSKAEVIAKKLKGEI